MRYAKLIIACTAPALMAASCNEEALLPDPQPGYSWQTVQATSGLNDQARNGYIGPPAWADDFSRVSGAEQYYQRKNVCDGFPVCVGYDTQDYRFRIYTQNLGSSDRLYLNEVTPGILSNLFHLESAAYWLVTHQTESTSPELVFSRATTASEQLQELGRSDLDFVDRTDSWWLPSPDGSVIGRAVCNRFPDFSGATITYPAINDPKTGVSVPYGHCALGFVNPDNGNNIGAPVMVAFPWADDGWDMNNEPYDSVSLPRYGFPYWKADGSFAVTDKSTAAFAVFPGDTSAFATGLRPCDGPITASSAINDAGEVLSVVDGTIAAVKSEPTRRFADCN